MYCGQLGILCGMELKRKWGQDEDGDLCFEGFSTQVSLINIKCEHFHEQSKIYLDKLAVLELSFTDSKAFEK
jgi:hypothetical protein